MELKPARSSSGAMASIIPVRIAWAQTLVFPSRMVVSANLISVILPSLWHSGRSEVGRASFRHLDPAHDRARTGELREARLAAREYLLQEREIIDLLGPDGLGEPQVLLR